MARTNMKARPKKKVLGDAYCNVRTMLVKAKESSPEHP